MKSKIIVILGPTASGKTEWGIKIAKKFSSIGRPPPEADEPVAQASGWNGAEIICADSRTVYKYFNIGTAKPAKKERQGVKHHFLDFVDPRKKIYTAADFQRGALKIIKEIIERERLPIIVGGSALYIYALTRGYKFPGKSDTRLRRELESKTTVELASMLKTIRHSSFDNLDLNNRRRIIRYLEIAKNSKNKIRHSSAHSPLPYQFLKIGIDLPRKKVYQRIDKRTQSWMEEDRLINEVKNLLKKNISKDRIIEFGLGYREAIKYLDSEIKNQKELEERINFCQHNFVRRQMTWFKKDQEIKWCKNLNNAEKLVIDFLQK